MHLLHLLPLLFTLTLAQDLSSLVSQYLGDANPTPRLTGDTSNYNDVWTYSLSFSACTNAMHAGLFATTALGSDYAQRVAQNQADLACLACTSLSLSRVDECCAKAASADCFNGYANGVTHAATTTTKAGGATVTAASTGRVTVTSANRGNVLGRSNRDILAESMFMTLLAFLGLAI